MRKHMRITAILICLGLLMGAISACSPQQNADNPAPGQAQDANNNQEQQNPAGENNESSVVQAILDSYSTREFAAGTVNSDDLQLILQSGAKAPSARNSQPWHFTVVSGSKVTEIMNQAAEGNVLIIISGMDNAGEGMPVDYDCGLASAYLYLAAQSLGYGAHIYMGGVSDINQNRRDELQIPTGYTPLMMMLIGNTPDGVDGISSSTPRNALSETVTYIE